MSNNKQSSVEWLYEKMFVHHGLITIEEFEQAKAMHKEEIRKAYCYGEYYKDTKLTTDYYNETFGDNNEQAMIDYNKMEEEWEIDNYNEMNNEQQ
jgi:hypothetical protein